MESLFRSILQHASQYTVPIISDATADFLRHHLAFLQPKLVWEIGSAIGHSSATIATAITPRGGRLYSCEISLPSYRFARNHLHAASLQHCTLYHGDATRIPWSVLLEKESIDYVFIDAAKREYLTYIQIVRPFVKKGGVIVCDDVIMYAHKTGDLLDTVSSLGGHCELVPLSDNDGLLIISRQDNALSL